MPVYIIRAGDTDMVKIGWADDPAGRCRNLQTAHWERLAVIRVIDVSRAAELWMQQRYASHHVYLEWFKLCDEMLSVEPPFGIEAENPPDLISLKRQEAACAIIEALGDTAEVASQLGVSLSVVSNMKARGISRTRTFDMHQLAVKKGVAAVTAEAIWAAAAPAQHELRGLQKVAA